jgi:hypothetical protein
LNLDKFKGFDYETGDEDGEIMLSELPLSMIKDSIRQQFQNPITYGNNDFVQTFETRYAITKEDMDEENEDEINELYTQFVGFMRDIFKEKLSIGFPYLEDMPEHEQLELIHYTYRFFIINMKENYLTFVYNYILEHKKELAELLPKKKDVTTNSLKEFVDDEEDVTIVAGITDCLEHILYNDDITIAEFLRLSRGDGPNLENDFINDKYDDFNINGNFIIHYATMLDETSKIEIECQVRNKILSKYQKQIEI